MFAGVARADYPERTVRLVVGFAPGSGSDIVARIIAQKVAQLLQSPIVVDNHPGAAGTIATQGVARAAPDGYTLVLGTTSTLLTSPAVYPAVRYDINRDFRPVTLVARTAFVLVVSAGNPEVKDLADWVRVARRGTVTFGSAGTGTIGHLASELLLKNLGIAGTNIPYRGSSEALKDVSTGELLFATDATTAVLPFVRAGRLRAIAVTSTARIAALPDVPTLAEAGGRGLENFSLYAWWGVLAPAGTPDRIVDRLHAVFAAAVSDATVQDSLKMLELEPMAGSPSQFADLLQREAPVWTGLVTRAGIKSGP